jgi:hypothetical protein
MRRRDTPIDPEVEHGLRELEAALAGEPAADPDLALLVADVDAARPAPDATFLASLDARVHAGFPRERDTPARHRTPLVAGVVVVGIATSGGGGGSRDDVASSASTSSSASSGRVETLATPAAAPTVKGARPALETQSSQDAASASASASSSGSSSAKAAPPKAAPFPAIPSPDRKVERAAELTLTAAPDDVQDTADGVVRETQASGGYVQRSDVHVKSGGGDASFTLRIPSARLDDTLHRLSKLAHVGALNQSATDITAQTASAADRLSDARATRQAILRALGKATTAREIASLKARLADNRDEIAAREGELDTQRRRADLATVSVTIEGTRAAAKEEHDSGGAWSPGDAAHDAGRVLAVAVGVALIALAVLLPFAILALLGWFGANVIRRRRREAALDAAA